MSLKIKNKKIKETEKDDNTKPNRPNAKSSKGGSRALRKEKQGLWRRFRQVWNSGCPYPYGRQAPTVYFHF